MLIAGNGLPTGNGQDIAVTGIHGYIDATVNSQMTIPMDLCPSVEEVKIFKVNESLAGFQENVLSYVKNDKKVLVIVVSDFSQIFDNVKETISKGQEISDGNCAVFNSSKNNDFFLISTLASRKC